MQRAKCEIGYWSGLPLWLFCFFLRELSTAEAVRVLLNVLTHLMDVTSNETLFCSGFCVWRNACINDVMVPCHLIRYLHYTGSGLCTAISCCYSELLTSVSLYVPISTGQQSTLASNHELWMLMIAILSEIPLKLKLFTVTISFTTTIVTGTRQHWSGIIL